MTHPDPRLIDRYLAGQATAEEGAALRHWLEAHPGDAALADALPGALAEDEPDWDTDAAWTRLAARLGAPAAGAASGARSVARVQPEPAPALSIVPARPRRRAWALPAGITALAAALAAIMFGWHAGVFHTAPAGAPPLAELVTPAGRLATLHLADGSTVRLGAGSRLRYPAGPGARELYLEGQAFFAVTHDAAHPFVLHAGGVTVRDLGTEFAVTAYPGAAGVRVVLAQGAVSLTPQAGRPRSLRPGELARIDALGHVEVQRADPRPYLSWTTGVLSFEDTPLAEVLPELGHWFGVEVRASDATLARRPVTAEFRGESLEHVLDALALALEAHWRRQGRTVLLEPGRTP